MGSRPLPPRLAQLSFLFYSSINSIEVVEQERTQGGHIFCSVDRLAAADL